jgi:hypothetical protein
MFLDFPAQESHSKLFVTNLKAKDLWEDPCNAGMRLLHSTRPKVWKADDDFFHL